VSEVAEKKVSPRKSSSKKGKAATRVTKKTSLRRKRKK
jgi:hypothetical protein